MWSAVLVAEKGITIIWYRTQKRKTRSMKVEEAKQEQRKPVTLIMSVLVVFDCLVKSCTTRE
jgi:hypothetical protein